MQNTRYKDIFLFKENAKTVLKKLIAEDDNPMLYLGILIFLDIGLALSGFHERDDSQKGVSVFERGTYDRDLERMAPFIFKKPRAKKCKLVAAWWNCLPTSHDFAMPLP